MSVSIADSLANYLTDLQFDDLPKNVVEKAKMCLIDTIGVTLAGSRTETGRMIISLVKEWGGNEEATIFGDGCKVPSANAALVNGTLGHIHELDDGHRVAMGHPGVTSIPAAMAIAEKVGAKGKELITATVLGYEVFIRLAMSVNPSHRDRGFHTTGTCGVFGAAAAAGKVLGLDKKSMVNALGIAGIQAAGLIEVMRGESRLKPLNAGKAAYNGVLAALLAKKGFTAPYTIFEGNDGFLRAYSDKYDIRTVTNGLGEDYLIKEIYVKPYAACRNAHPTIDCVLHLAKEHSLTPEEIEKVVVKTYYTAYKLTGTEYKPKTESTAKFSLPYCVAAALTYGNLGPDEFTIKKITDKVLLQLASKVHVEVDAELDKLAPRKRGAFVTITTNSGGIYEWKVDNPRGEPEIPLSTDEVMFKFQSLVGPVLGYDRAQDILDIMDKYERLDDIRKKTKFFSFISV